MLKIIKPTTSKHPRFFCLVILFTHGVNHGLRLVELDIFRPVASEDLCLRPLHKRLQEITAGAGPASDNFRDERQAYGAACSWFEEAIYVPDTREESDWCDHKAFAVVRSWIVVPLVASDSVLGLLSIGSRQPRAFSTRHFHFERLLGIPAAVAIHNARLYEWAQICAAERQTLLKKLNGTTDKTPKHRAVVFQIKNNLGSNPIDIRALPDNRFGSGSDGRVFDLGLGKRQNSAHRGTVIPGPRALRIPSSRNRPPVFPFQRSMTVQSRFLATL
jgi:hypothetical protein